MPAVVLTLNPALVGAPSLEPELLRTAGLYVICLILAVSVHEFAHAFAADRLGDGTPEAQGRLTLNPAAHIDPVGTILLPLIMAVSSSGMLFGWGRPVQFTPANIRRSVSMRAGSAIVAFAGPLSNLLQAAAVLALAWGLSATGALPPWLLEPLKLFFSLNLLLFGFNLFPIHPLDGGKIVGWMFGRHWEPVDEFLARFGGIVLIALIFTPIPGYVLSPLMSLGDTAFPAVVR